MGASISQRKGSQIAECDMQEMFAGLTRPWSLSFLFPDPFFFLHLVKTESKRDEGVVSPEREDDSVKWRKYAQDAELVK